jgi:hypothetical protein
VNRRILVAIGAFAAMIVGQKLTAQSTTSRYTSIRPERCRSIVQDTVSGLANYDCVGISGIRVWLGGSEERAVVSFGPDAPHERAARRVFNPMNSTGETLEWRGTVQGRSFVPYATILRWSLNDYVNDATVTRSMLVVTRLGRGSVCHVAYVDVQSNPQANALARQAADSLARGFRCGHDRVAIVGSAGRLKSLVSTDPDGR